MYVRMETFQILNDLSYLFEVEVWLLKYPKDVRNEQISRWTC